MVEETRRIYLLDEFLLDVEQRRLSRNGEAIHLTNRPFQILVYLIERRDRLVTSAELLDCFWGGKDVYEDSMRKAVGAIRKALQDGREQPRFIETRYGEGYRYIGPLAEPSPIAADGVVESTQERFLPEHTAPATSEPKPVQLVSGAGSRRKVISLGFGIFLLALLCAAFVLYQRRRPEAVRSIRSIAVLPLKNLSNDHEQEYFSDGVTEILINELGKIRDLKVISRSSVFAYKGKEIDPREIGKRFGVTAVLEGGVRQDASTVRVMVRLVSTEDGRVLWTGDSRTRARGESAVVQDEIGCSVAVGLKAVVCGEVQHKPGTANPLAYEAYLQGVYRRRERDPMQAADFFTRATAADPNYALAWAGLSEAYAVMETNSMVPPHSLTAKARECAFKAVSLDASLPAPYAALGLLAAFSDRDWGAGERYFQQALAANPNYAIAHAWYANTLLAQAKFAEAEGHYLRARELDPLNTGFLNNLAETYYYWRQPERCLVPALKVLESEPENDWAKLNRAKCLTQLGRYDEALQVAQKIGLIPMGLRLFILSKAGRVAEARELQAQAIRESSKTSPLGVASVYLALGDHEAAFVWLQKAADAQQSDLVSLKIEPGFDPIREDARFRNLLRGIGLEP